MASAKTPLQDVVSTICDALADLPPDDQARALEAVRLTLGLDAASQEARPSQALVPVVEPTPAPLSVQPSAPPSLWEPSLFEEPPAAPPRLPTVVVQMMGDRPMVMGQQVGRRTLVVVGPQRRGQLPRPHVTSQADGDVAQDSPVQVPSPRRGGYVLRRR